MPRDNGTAVFTSRQRRYYLIIVHRSDIARVRAHVNLLWAPGASAPPSSPPPLPPSLPPTPAPLRVRKSYTNAASPNKQQWRRARVGRTFMCIVTGYPSRKIHMWAPNKGDICTRLNDGSSYFIVWDGKKLYLILQSAQQTHKRAALLNKSAVIL